MSRPVAHLVVALFFYGKVAFCDVAINTENEFEGSLCFIKNGSHGVCRTSCNDDASGEYRTNVCDSNPTMYCCVDQAAAQLYPTIYDGCMKRRLAENFDIKKKRELLLLVLKLRELDKTLEMRNKTHMESCEKTAKDLDPEERQNFLEYCQQIGHQQYSTLTGNYDFKSVDEPSIVAIGYFDGDDNIRWICMGHLVHPLYVLTSAHCIREHPDVPNVVRFGRDNLYDGDFYSSNVKTAFTYPISHIVTSNQYNKETLAADIALLKLHRDLETEKSEELQFKPTPACLWTKSELPTENLTISGYTHVRHQGTVSLTSKSDCADKLNTNMDQTRACYVCHFPDQGYITPSLLYSENLKLDVPYLVAMGSCGLPCHGDEPAHFTLIYPHLKWIESVISQDN